MVALNYQTSDEPMWINKGKFLDNGTKDFHLCSNVIGNCGYVLKPSLVINNPAWNPTYASQRQKTLFVEVLMFTILSLMIVDFEC